ncbi:MAG TPA: flagellar filament capping protein FliD [Planctomycetes bacterium]|nr:flagellar filament capping protein FliD [Planctomycetota bacterium]HIJ70270.1 flagellar filament capping protein FliD [Planctomycetota bacterium]
MAEITFPGLATGIDTSEIVRQLVEVESRTIQAREEERADQQIKRDTLTDLQSNLNTFRTTVRALADSGLLRAFDTSTSDSDIMTASANSNASEGNHALQIKQLSSSDRWVHDGLKYATSYVGEGKFVISYNNEELVIQTTAETTLEDLVGLINNDADNPGINASILVYDDGSDGVYHLVLSGQDSGSDYQITINSSNTEVWLTSGTALQYSEENAELTTKLQDLDNTTGTIETGDYITIQGTDHYGQTVDTNISINQYTTIQDLLDEIEDAYNGTVKATLYNGQIKLTAIADGASSLTVTSFAYTDASAEGTTMDLPTFSLDGDEGGTITSGDLISGFAAADFTETQSAQDSKVKVDGYPPDSQTAEQQDLTTTGGSASAGTYTLTYQGHTTADIAYGADASTVQAALEALDNVSSGDITVSGTDLNNGLTFTFRDTAGDVGLITIDASGLTTTGTHAITETTGGHDGWISRNGNTIDDVVSGVTINLHDTTYNTVTETYDDVELTLTRDTETLKEKMNEMINAYNEIIKFLQENADYDAETKTAPILYGDYSITTIRNQIKNPFILAAGGFTSADSFTMPKDIGLTINSDGLLELDNTEFDEAISEDYLGVLNLIGAMKTGSSAGEYASSIKFYAAGTQTQAGAYDVRVYGTTGGPISQVQIKTTDEDWSEARTVDAENIDGNVVTGNWDTDDNGNPLYPEHSLTFTVDLDQLIDDSTPIEATVYVKQGFAGDVKDVLDDVLAYDGRIPVSKKSISDYIERLNEQIETEQTRLDAYEERLVLRFARLERTLQLLNQQMSSLNMLG